MIGNINKTMRAKERIPIILDAINIPEFLKDANAFDQETIDNCINDWILSWEEIKKFWLDNPDLRLMQVLINTGLLPNAPGFYYYEEEVDYCLKKGYLQPRQILFWGSYGKEGKGPYQQILIKNMTTEHLKACLETQVYMNTLYRETMISELKLRKEKIKKDWLPENIKKWHL